VRHHKDVDQRHAREAALRHSHAEASDDAERPLEKRERGHEAADVGGSRVKGQAVCEFLPFKS
jgi:hypothetical protein